MKANQPSGATKPWRSCLEPKTISDLNSQRAFPKMSDDFFPWLHFAKRLSTGQKLCIYSVMAFHPFYIRLLERAELFIKTWFVYPNAPLSTIPAELRAFVLRHPPTTNRTSPQVLCNSSPLDVWEAQLVVDHKASKALFADKTLNTGRGVQGARLQSASSDCRWDGRALRCSIQATVLVWSTPRMTETQQGAISSVLSLRRGLRISTLQKEVA